MGVTLAIGFCVSFLPLGGPRKAPSAAESTLRLREPSKPKAIDTRFLNDEFLMSLAEEFPVDQPRCPTAAHRTFDDAHELTSTKEKGCDKTQPFAFHLFSCSVSGGGDP
jgi:hypothetical protein